MGKKSKAVAAGAAVAAGPSGLRRVLGGCLVVVLLAGLALAGLVAVATWMASRDGGVGGDEAGLPCPPEQVAIAYSPADAPQEVKDAVEQALTSAGREVTEGGYGEGAGRDMVVSWWEVAKPGPPEVSGSGTVSLRLEQPPTAEEVRDALGDRLAPCETPEPTEEPDEAPEEAQEPEEDASGDAGGISWPWASGMSPVAGVGVLVATWWVAGPHLVRWAAEGLWRARLARRRWQRWQWRREVAHGDHELPTWPEPPVPGERWDRDEDAMLDRRTFRQQVAADEPERRSVLRERMREARLRGEGIVPTRLWRLIYRVPQPNNAPTEGAPEKEEVSS